ncbi:chondroitinase-B domain-containing protein [Aquimarina pacifica]|uniref:chondroitinase-B domain-containing protein n=1 Tax=Aquimarina pacifica TaxID=1296415 RepID=UPI000472F425|nr:chondroitinase-B domain-containing protein [Aquimarina pacifica]
MKTINYFYTTLLLLIPLLTNAAEYNISSVEDLENLNLSAGDVVILADGTYNSDERILFSGIGTANNPITFKSETPGGVIFNNGLKIDIAGEYLIVDGFYWNGGYGASNFIQFRNGTNYAQHCTIKNCAINGLQVDPDDVESGTSVKHRWIVLYGNYNTVTNCSFMNKSTSGALILAEYEYNAEGGRCNEVGHIISNNYFFNYEKIDPDLTNAGDSETIRIGTSEYQNVNSAATVSNNYFVQADGENEIITNKSANNSYLNNTFRRCRGSLVMRHGPNATVVGNYFLGENVEGTGAIRITDSDHTITNNYIQNCVTTQDFAAWNNGLTFVGGNTSSVSNCASTSVSNSYQDVENIDFSNNTFINTESPIYFNDSRDGADNVYGTVTDNVIYFGSNNSNISNIISGAYSTIGNSLTFSGNVYEGSDLGESVNGFTSANLSATSNGEIFTISGANGAGANISSSPFTDNDVASTVGACFLDANGNSLTGCDGTSTDYLTVSSVSEFDANGGSQTITITSNINWTVSESSSWLSVNTTSGSNNGSTTVTVNANTTTSSRTTTITISGNSISRNITISQEGEEDTTTCQEQNAFSTIEGEDFCEQSGIQIDNDNTYAGWIQNGDWIMYEDVDFGTGASSISVLASSQNSGGTIEIRQGSTTGTLIGNVTVTSTNSWDTWLTFTEDISEISGTQDIYLVFTGGSGYLLNVDSFEFTESTEPNNDNLALDGTASQSSNYSSTLGQANLAIDGNTNGNWNGGSVTHTLSLTGSWWQVVLNQETNIGEIVIYNRINCCMDRLSNFTVTVINSSGNEVYTQTITETPNPSITIDANGAFGNTVKITTNLINTPLSLAEVEVYEGEGSSSSCSSGTNLALNSTIIDFSSEQNTTNTVSNLIDGNDGNRWSAEGYPQYAVIDLGDHYNINEINLVTHNDRDYQFTIEGSTTSATSGLSTLVDASNNSDSGPINRTFTTQIVRYVKLTVVGANSYADSWISISDFEIICAGDNAKNTFADTISEVTAYPSPFTKSLSIQINKTDQTIGNVKLFDLFGKLIISQSINGRNGVLNNCDAIAKGIYLLQVANPQGQTISVTKVTKE